MLIVIIPKMFPKVTPGTAQRPLRSERGVAAQARSFSPSSPLSWQFRSYLDREAQFVHITLMKITWDELTIAPSDYTTAELFSEWRWLLGDTFQIVLVSSLGDMFLADFAGHIHWLDAGAGRLTEIATSLAEFDQLRQQQVNADEWFVPQLVGDIMKGGARLARGECFGYKVAPVLGGKMEPSNFEPTDLAVHFGILGQIHEQIKDLPEGTPIGKIKFK